LRRLTGFWGRRTRWRPRRRLSPDITARFPFDEIEVSVLFALIGARLAVSVTNSAHRKTLKPNDPYVTVSEAPAWEALERLGKINPRFAHYMFRAACGLPVVPKSEKIKKWLGANGGAAASILDVDLRTAPTVVFDLSVGSAFLGADPCAAETLALTEKMFAAMKRAGAAVGVGRYDEPRLLYTSPLFGASGDPTDERRTVHLGMDFFVERGAAVKAPLDGAVHATANNSAPLDYGPVVILRHATSEGEEFFTLYGHLTRESLAGLKVGQRIARGERFARVGSAKENGGWAPHLHFQIILDLVELGTDFPGVAYASQRAVWTSLSPDPNLLLGIPVDRFPAQAPAFEETLAARRALLGKSLSISYQRPLKIARGWMQYLYDDTGRTYLDVYNKRAASGAQPPSSGSRGTGAACAAQHQYALSARQRQSLCRAAHAAASRTTARLFFCELGKRGQ